MNLLQRNLLLLLVGFCGLFVIFKVTNTTGGVGLTVQQNPEYDVKDLEKRIDELERRVDTEKQKIQSRARRLQLLSARDAMGVSSGASPWNKPIAILIFVCNRAAALKAQLTQLLRFRPSKERFPIVISQDCDSEEVANVVRSFEGSVEYLKHTSSQKAKIEVPPIHRRYKSYYFIGRHYRLGLVYIFDKRDFDSVIILEDDLDVSSDFFDYFASTRWLLDADPSLFCVSAWNDNGRPSLIDLTAHNRLYRSDFFPGLGWMMTRKLWTEFGFQWVKSGPMAAVFYAAYFLATSLLG